MKRRQRLGQTLEKMRSILGFWIVGRLISMCIVGILTTAGLWLLNVPQAIALGVVAGLLTFIPNFGPILAVIPQALLALEVGVNTLAYVVILNVVLQAVESYLVTPVVQRYEVSLPPALTICSQLILGVLLGAIGVIMAAPLTAAILVAVQMLYIHDRLGDPRPRQLAR